MPTRMSWSVLLPCTLAACYKLDDDDQLLQKTRGLLGLYASVSDTCLPCVQEACNEQAPACADDPACKKAIECQLKDNPGAYRDCLSELFDMDASSSSDPNGAWEGSKSEFGSCVERNCQVECKRDRSDWTCEGWKGMTQGNNYTLTLSVGILGSGFGSTGFRVASGVSIQTCSPLQRCGGDKETDGAGTVNIQTNRLGADGLYFKLEPGDSGLEFPTTYYYPTHLGSSSRQPVSVYLFATDTIASAHEKLGLDVVMFPDAAQALILPDGCREQSQPSATEVTVHLEGMAAPLPPCQGDAIQDGGLVGGPCVWYGREDGAPMMSEAPEDQYTRGRGAAILGLEGRPYVLRVCDRKNERLLARREVVMKANSLTVARTWPLTGGEMDAGDACFQSSTPDP